MDGYFKLEPAFFEDSIANYSFNGYHHKAFLFQKDFTYIIASNVNKRTEYFFHPNEFDKNFPNEYFLDEENLIITHCKGQEWEFSESFNKINENLYSNEKQRLTFTKWKHQDC